VKLISFCMISELSSYATRKRQTGALISLMQGNCRKVNTEKLSEILIKMKS